MALGNAAPVVRCSVSPLRKLAVDLICLPFFSDENLENYRDLDGAVGGAIGRARSSGELTGKPHQLFFSDVSDPEWQCRRILLIGSGPEGNYNSVIRTVSAAAGKAARERGVERIALICRGNKFTEVMMQASAEGLVIGSFRDRRFKREAAEDGRPLSVSLVSEESLIPAAQEAAERGVLLASCSNIARELVNEPGNLFTPEVFSDRALELVTGPDTIVEVLGDEAIESHQMGLLQGVAQGSAQPARVIVMRYEPQGISEGPVLGLVGKGVTFDSGGISLKPGQGMERMKGDMAGGAAVVAAMRAISQLRPQTRVIAVVPAVENMPGGRAIRPGDVLTGADGTKVEVINTDAEGRLILADSLTLVQRLGATHLIDIATLTGACVVALGHHASGLMGTPCSWVEIVRQAAEYAGERAWPLPMFEEYAEQLKSETADLANVGGRSAGAITAGMFLKTFVAGRPWAHLDIAGTARYQDNKPYHEKGASGVGVRTLVAVACQMEQVA